MKNKRSELLEEIKNIDKLDRNHFEKIDYINLHAHSTYSLQDAVGQVHEHFSKTIEVGHCGCSITDHGSYASFIDLYNLKDNAKGNKKVKELFKKHNLSEHPVVMGSELYIIDDRHILPLERAARELNFDLIESILKKMSKNPKWASVFGIDTKKSVISIQNDENKKEKNSSIGSELLNELRSLSKELLIEQIDKFNAATLRSKSYKYNHITLLVKSPEGHSNLCKLTSIGSLPENFYSRPRIRLTHLLENKEGLIVTSGCFVGMIPQAIYRKTGEEKEFIELFKREFGGDFYIEMHISDIRKVWDAKTRTFVDQPEGNPQKPVNDRLLELVQEYNLESKVYITQDSHMPNKEDKDIQDIIIMNDPGNKSGWHFYNTYYIMSIEEMYNSMKKYYPEYTNEQFVNWCFNSMEVLEKCRNVVLDTSLKFLSPDYENHPLNNPIRINKEYLEKLLVDGIAQDEIDQVILRDQIRESIYREHGQDLEQVKDLEVSFNFNEKQFRAKIFELVDLVKTQESVKHRKELDEKLSEIFKYEEYYVQKTKLFYKDEIDLHTLLLTAIDYAKIDFHNEKQRTRFFYELDIIQFNGMLALSDYFMTFERISAFVLDIDEFKGPGRGSAAGCLVSYAIDITDIEPDKYSLLMERFLQPERIGFMQFALKDFPLEYNRDEVSYELFKKHKNSLDRLKGLLDGLELSDNAKEELYFLERNLFVADYLVELKESHSNLENINNSKICELIGLCSKAHGKIDMTDRSMPDIDYDSSCRDKICEYLVRLHGRDKVVYIGTYGSLKIKSAIKEVLRIRGVSGSNRVLSSEEINAITKECDKVKISEEDNSRGELWIFNYILEQNSVLREFFTTNYHIKKDVENILGTYKNMGIHAAGIILSPQEIWKFIPCKFDKVKNAYVTELAKDEAEQLGFIKLDMLGISTGEDINLCRKMIKQRYGIDYQGKWEEILENLPEEVNRAYERVQTTSIFQMNTPTAQDGLRKTTRILDPVNNIAALTSVKRPGPMGMGADEDFILKNNGQREASYLHPMLEPILKDTFGVLVYQEQVMQIVQSMGGFTKFEADKIRKAMGKKKFDVLAKFEEKFINYAQDVHQVDKKVAAKIWEYMAKFAEYGFNKSHAICYSALSCICMYFKEKYPKEWISAVFTRASLKNSDKDKENYKRFYREWKNYLKSPSVQFSKRDYEIIGEYIYMPLFSIKRIGEAAANKIIDLQPYKDYEDFFLKLIASENNNKTLVEYLVYSGAMDSFRPSKIDIDLSQIDLSTLKKLEMACDIAEFKTQTKIDREIIFKIRDTLEIGVPLDDDQMGEFESFIKDNDLESQNINKFDFRKYVLEKYYQEYKHIKLKKGLKDLLTEKNMLSYELILEIFKNRGIDSVEALQGEEFSKFRGETKVGLSKSLTLHLTPKNQEEVDLVIKNIRSKTNKNLLLEELDCLNFTSFDFNSIFEEEINNLKPRIGNKRIYSPGDIDRFSNSVQFKLNTLLSVVDDQLKYSDNLLQRSKLILLTYKKIEENLSSWHAKYVFDKLERGLEKLEAKLSVDWKINLRLASIILGVNYRPKFFINVQLKRNLTKENFSLAKKVVRNESRFEDMEITGALRFDIPYVVDLFLMYLYANNKVKMDEALKYNENKEAFEYVRSLFVNANKRLDKPREQILNFFDKLKVNEDYISNLLENFNKTDLILENISKFQNSELSKEEKYLLNTSNYIACTVFKPEKKHFIKEVGKGDRAQKIMNLLLTNEDSQVKMTVFSADKEKVYKNTSEGEKIVTLTNEIKDFLPAIIQFKLKVNLRRDNEVSLSYVSGNRSFYFIEDQINKIN